VDSDRKAAFNAFHVIVTATATRVPCDRRPSQYNLVSVCRATGEALPSFRPTVNHAASGNYRRKIKNKNQNRSNTPYIVLTFVCRVHVNVTLLVVVVVVYDGVLGEQ
jgi:hypothetical protein